jgi:hypothetical protein
MVETAAGDAAGGGAQAARSKTRTIKARIAPL